MVPGAWTLGPELPGFESQLSLGQVIPGVWGRKGYDLAYGLQGVKVEQ